MPNLSNNELIDLVEQIVVRRCTQTENTQSLHELATITRESIVWRTVLHSPQAAKAIWQHLETKLMDMERVMSITTEFLVRSELKSSSLQELSANLANYIGWAKSSDALPREIVQFSGETRGFTDTLSKNPWLIVLYLMGQSDLVRKLAQLQNQFSAPRSRGGAGTS